MPLKKYAEISYRVRCVSVENERVFGDVYVTQQTRNLLYGADGYQFPRLYNRKQCNLIHRAWEGPDFMELNRKKAIRRASVAPPKIAARPLRRSKSVGDAGNMVGYEYRGNESLRREIETRYPRVIFIFIDYVVLLWILVFTW